MVNYDSDEAQRAAEDARRGSVDKGAPPSKKEANVGLDEQIQKWSDNGTCVIDDCDEEAVSLEYYSKPASPLGQTPPERPRVGLCEEHTSGDYMKQEYERSTCDSCGDKYFVGKLDNSRFHEDKGICVECTVEQSEEDDYKSFLRKKRNESRRDQQR